MITNELIFTPEFWYNYEIDARKYYNYIAPDNTLWNIVTIENDKVNLWAVNGWGQFIYRNEDYNRFLQVYKEYKFK